MNLANWFTPRRATSRGKAMSLYARGVGNANAHSPVVAIENYTDAIQVTDAPVDVVAMALFNRSLAFIAIGEFAKGVDDLTKVLEMPNAPVRVKRLARQKLAKRQSSVRRHAALRTA